jgi:hypothetical protein
LDHFCKDDYISEVLTRQREAFLVNLLNTLNDFITYLREVNPLNWLVLSAT